MYPSLEETRLFSALTRKFPCASGHGCTDNGIPHSVDITISGIPGTAVLDSRARASLTSLKLQEVLKKLDLRFVCTEGGPEVATLLGVDFARLAKLVVNYYHNDTYHFHDASHEENAFVRKEKHAALPLSPFKAVQPEPMEEDVLDDPYQSPVDFDEFIKSDEWSDITRDYGPIVSPLPPISPRVAPSTIHV
jgi:hypothetical protein